MPRNPYSAARFAPGEIPWLGADLGSLLDPASRRGARHQVIGPHGSGKSTLLRHLELEARRRGLDVARFRGSESPSLLRLPQLVLIDEVEELSTLSRLLVRWRAVSLVVSTHLDCGFPTLARCEATESVARHVIARLGEVPPPDLPSRLARHGGNLREVLFELYDDFEHTSRMSDRAASRD